MGKVLQLEQPGRLSKISTCIGRERKGHLAEVTGCVETWKRERGEYQVLPEHICMADRSGKR